MNRRLYRSPDDRVLAGVAGGMAESYEMDPSLVRVVWALLIIFTGGVFFILYVIMALVVPLRPAGYTAFAGSAGGDETEPGFVPGPPAAGGPATAGGTPTARDAPAAGAPPPVRRRGPRHDSDNSGTLIVGAILIIVGALFLLRQFIDIDIGRLWPLAVIGLGILLIVSAFGRRAKAT